MSEKSEEKKIRKDISPKNIFFDSEAKMFCQLRNKTNTGWMCSCNKYYADANTSFSEYPYSDDYIQKNFVAIDNIADFATYDGIGWKVKK